MPRCPSLVSLFPSMLGGMRRKKVGIEAKLFRALRSCRVHVGTECVSPRSAGDLCQGVCQSHVVRFRKGLQACAFLKARADCNGAPAMLLRGGKRLIFNAFKTTDSTSIPPLGFPTYFRDAYPHTPTPAPALSVYVPSEHVRVSSLDEILRGEVETIIVVTSFEPLNWVCARVP